MTFCDADIEEGNRTVRVEGAGLGVADLRRLADWLRGTARWIERQQDKEDGGRRWVFTRGVEPTACYMAGRRCTTQVVTLVPVTVRARRRWAWQCASCDTDLPPGTSAWRQKPKTWGGHSHKRFCDACVQRGGPPPKPSLCIVRGAAEATTAPRGELSLASGATDQGPGSTEET